MNQRQLQIVDYLREENRVLREQLGDYRLRFDDNQRRRLAVKLSFRSQCSSIASNSVSGTCSREKWKTFCRSNDLIAVSGIPTTTIATMYRASSSTAVISTVQLTLMTKRTRNFENFERNGREGSPSVDKLCRRLRRGDVNGRCQAT
jgi:hypothetical protein